MQQERFAKFTLAISKINGDVQKLKAKYTAKLGLKAVHILWIYLLREHPDGLHAAQLAEAAGVNRSLVSREIDLLLSQGLLCQPEQPAARRYAWKLRLTPKGMEKAEEIALIVGHMQQMIGREISRQDLAVFYKVLDALSQNIGALLNSEIWRKNL